jgi:ribosomal protein S18 acetylase RimI-like enzyme
MLLHAQRRLCRLAQGHRIGRSSFYQAAVADSQAGTAALLLGHGYVPARRTYQMVRPNLEVVPDLPLPPGLEVRPARPEHYRAIWEANQEAFRDHWGHVPVTEEDYQRWMGDPTFNPGLWCVAWDGDQVAGMVLNLVNAAENKRYNRGRGYTEDICVRRPWRRQGLARALIARSLIVLRDQGMTEAALGVDAENWSGAMRLYQSMGYRIAQRWSLYRRPLTRS